LWRRRSHLRILSVIKTHNSLFAHAAPNQGRVDAGGLWSKAVNSRFVFCGFYERWSTLYASKTHLVVSLFFAISHTTRPRGVLCASSRCN
jgi:hypothetical protein